MPPETPRRRVGIEKVWAYPGTLMLDLEELARVRDHDPADLRDNLMVRRRSLIPLWEDPVTLAVNAAQPMLTDADRESIALLIVATESSVDQGKPISSWAHRFLGIQPNCRNYESKFACYGGTVALMMAAHWVASGYGGDRKALVLTTDVSRASLHEPFEYTMGSGAVALLVSADPQVLELELHHNGFWTQEVSDTFRPTSRVETGNGETSLYCYLDALEGAYQDFLRKAGPVDFDTYFKRNVYHVPFGGLTFQAHRTLLRHTGRVTKSQAFEHFRRRVEPGLAFNRQIGATYSGSTFFALMGLLDQGADLTAGDRIGVFSYGSGSCGEFYSAVVGPGAREAVARVRLQQQLDARVPMTVRDYETLEQARFALIDAGDIAPDRTAQGDLWAMRYAGQGKLVLEGVSNYFRRYAWS